MDIERMYREYFTPVYRYTLSLVRDPDLAEEITQETFFRALKKIDSYRGEASLRAWLCQIAKNICFDTAKKGMFFASANSQKLQAKMEKIASPIWRKLQAVRLSRSSTADMLLS